MPSLTSELKVFTEQIAPLIAKTKLIAAALPANTAQVWPGGAKFNTIQAALNSISGANPQEQYQVAVGPGTYNENVVMKDYVYVIGSGQDVTIITAPAQSSPFNGVVNSASGGGISDITINAPGAGWGSWPVGVKICGQGAFHISGVTMNVGAGATGDNARGITNNTGSYAGNIIVSQSIISLTGDSQTTCSGIELFGMSGITMLLNLVTVQCAGGGQNFGITTAVNATVTLEDSKVIAATMALDNSDGSALITANQCTIDGPISSGVVVNN